MNGQRYSYFPGCSLHSTGSEYQASTQAVLRSLGIDLVELPDWNCCGASSAHSLDHQMAIALPARILALAQLATKQGCQSLVTPCAACYNRLKSTDWLLRQERKSASEQKLCEQIETLVGFKFTGTVGIKSVLEIISDIDSTQVIARCRLRLDQLKVVAYYGCLLVRPPQITQFDNPDNPHIMPDILKSLGADVRNWSYATECCGGSLSLSRSDIVFSLVGKLVQHAREAGADAVVTACPLCQVNFEMRQSQQPMMPVFYFTELLGLAFGLPETSSWWKKHLIDPRPLLRQTGLLV